MNTPSGRPEVTIAAGPREVKDALVSALVDHGYFVMNDAGPMVVAEKDAGLATQILFGSSLNRPQLKARFNVVKVHEGTATRVIGGLFMTGVYRQDATMEGAHSNLQIQYMLDCIAADLEHRTRPPAPKLPPVTVARSPRDAMNSRDVAAPPPQPSHDEQ